MGGLNQQIGQYGEKIAGDYLKRHGYKIIEQNLKISYQEIDIIAEQGDDLIFIEVKTRTSQKYGEGTEAVDESKQDFLNYAIEQYLDKHNLWSKEVRCDLILVLINKSNKSIKIKHYEDIL